MWARARNGRRSAISLAVRTREGRHLDLLFSLGTQILEALQGPRVLAQLLSNALGRPFWLSNVSFELRLLSAGPSVE